jgi:hypothetical protein
MFALELRGDVGSPNSPSRGTDPRVARGFRSEAYSWGNPPPSKSENSAAVHPFNVVKVKAPVMRASRAKTVTTSSVGGSTTLTAS